MSQCYFIVSIAGADPKRIVFELESKLCPKTCENFQSFCGSKTERSYKNTTFHRIIPGFMVQGGDYQNGDGTGGEAFAGGTLNDECFDMKHDGPFILSMANKGKNTAGSQFFITLGKAAHLDGKHVAFGRVIEGQDVIRAMADVETDDRDKPVNLQKIKILDSGIGNGKIDSDTEDSSSDEERETKKHSSRDKKRSKSDRKHEKKSKKKRKKYDRDDDRRRKKQKKYSSDDGSSDDEDSHREKKRRKKHKKSKHRKRRSDDDSSSSSDESSDSYHRKKKSKKKRSKKDSKSKSSDKTKSSSFSNDQMGGFGKYGIIKESDLRTSTKVQRNFEIWLEEVKGIPQGSNVAKWEMTENFKEYAEDYNTATLPHVKYYDYDKWELEDYNKKKSESKSKKGAISDEFEFQEERKKKAEEKRRKELNMIRSTMSKEKIEEMKRQARMKAEMVNAYRTGDEEKRRRLEKKLKPDEK